MKYLSGRLLPAFLSSTQFGMSVKIPCSLTIEVESRDSLFDCSPMFEGDDKIKLRLIKNAKKYVGVQDLKRS